jgi:hypothetical protein
MLTSRLSDEEQSADVLLRRTLSFLLALRVQFESESGISMAHEFLNNLHGLLLAAKQCRQRPSEGVPADLLGQIPLSRRVPSRQSNSFGKCSHVHQGILCSVQTLILD